MDEGDEVPLVGRPKHSIREPAGTSIVVVVVVVTSSTLPFPLRDRIVGSREREDARDRFE